MEIYGSEGSMVTPDPNNFTGGVEIFRRGDTRWEEIAVDHPYAAGMPGRAGGLRGLGAAEMADALRNDRPHRVSAELAMHALEVMTGFQRSADSGRVVTIQSRCERPRPIGRRVPVGSFD